MNRRRLMWQKAQSGLPEGYTAVNYLQSSGTQWINTEYILQSSDTVEFKAEYVRKGSLKHTTAYLCGSDRRFGDDFNISEDTKGYGIRDVFGPLITKSGAIPEVGTEFVVVSSISLLRVVVGETITEISKKAPTYTPVNFPVYLFTTNRNKTAHSAAFIGKIYYAKITNGQGEMTLNCIPCLDTEGVPCMFDLVSRKSFYNIGTGSFTWG